MNPQPAVCAQGVCYASGTRKLLTDVNLEVASGECLVITGPAAAGKSTLARVLTTLLTPHAGRVWIGGRDALAQPATARQQVGFVPQRAGVYRHLSVREHLEFYARLYQRPASSVDGALELLELRPVANELASRLSKEQRQRIHFGRLLIHDPVALVLDEPGWSATSGASPPSVHLLAELLELGKCLIIFARELHQAELPIHQRLRLADGRLEAWSGSEDLAFSASIKRPKTSGSEPLCWLQLRVLGAPQLAGLLERLSSVRSVEVHGDWLHLTHAGGPAATAELISHVVSLGYQPLALNASAEAPAAGKQSSRERA